MKQKTSMHTPSVKADLSDSMEMIVQLAEKSVIRIYHVLKQTKGWQIADGACPTNSITPISNRLWFPNLNVFRTYAGLVRLYNAINLIILFPSI